MFKELKNAIFSWHFIAAVSITALLFYMGIFEENIFSKKLSFAYIYFSAETMSPLFLFLPLIATIPYGSFFIDEANSGCIRFSLSRKSYTSYILLKQITVTVSGFLAVFLGLWLFVLLTLPFAGTVSDAQTAETILIARPYGALIKESVFFYIFADTFFMSAFASMWAPLAMVTCTYIKNRYISILLPTVAFFLIWTVSNRVLEIIPPWLYSLLPSVSVMKGNCMLFPCSNLLFKVCSTLLLEFLYQCLWFFFVRTRLRKVL